MWEHCKSPFSQIMHPDLAHQAPLLSTDLLSKVTQVPSPKASYWLVAQPWWHKPLKIKHLYHFCLVPGGQELAHSERANEAVKWFQGVNQAEYLHKYLCLNDLFGRNWLTQNLANLPKI